MEISANLYYSSGRIGSLNLKAVASPKGIKKLILNEAASSASSESLTRLRYDDPYLFNIFKQLEEYFKRKRKNFDIPFDLEGTDFQLSVWNELLNIPYGRTTSYGAIASKLGNPKLLRAVGRAIGTNPIPIIIPCHRVINNNGQLGGFSAGIKLKEELLELEGILSLELFSVKRLSAGSRLYQT